MSESGQAILFFLPHLIWRSLAVYVFGEDMSLVMQQASIARKAKDELVYTQTVEGIAQQLFRLSREQLDNRQTKWAVGQRWVVSRRWLPGVQLVTMSKRLGTRVVGTYLCIKLLYVVNLISQMYLIQAFLTIGRTSLQVRPFSLLLALGL
ncbi:unnamed protein product, partial [Protopolystoma xenopodis]